RRGRYWLVQDVSRFSDQWNRTREFVSFSIQRVLWSAEVEGVPAKFGRSRPLRYATGGNSKNSRRRLTVEELCQGFFGSVRLSFVAEGPQMTIDERPPQTRQRQNQYREPQVRVRSRDFEQRDIRDDDERYEREKRKVVALAKDRTEHRPINYPPRPIYGGEWPPLVPDDDDNRDVERP